MTRPTAFRRAINATLLAAAVVGGVAASPARARAAGPTLTVALFVPNTTIGGPYARAAYAKAFAERLGAALGRPARALVFGGDAQLDRAIGRGSIDVAIVDPLYFVSRAARLHLAPIAVATHRGAVTRRWALYVKSRGSLQGKTIAMADSGGADAAFVERVLLAGVAPLGRLFARTRRLRTVGNALSAVKFGQADGAVATVGDHGLTRACDLGRFINPLLVSAKRSLGAAQRAAIRRAALAIKQPGTELDGWRAVGDGITRARDALRARLLAPKLLAKPLVLRVEAVHPPRHGALRLARPSLSGYLGRR